MENRRKHYRHDFPPNHRPRVLLEAAGGNGLVEAEMVNLSIGGMCVKSENLRASQQRWTALLTLDAEQAPLRLPTESVYAAGAGGPTCGFRFLTICDLHVHEKNEDAIWKFLVAQQRRSRQSA